MGYQLNTLFELLVRVLPFVQLRVTVSFPISKCIYWLHASRELFAFLSSPHLTPPSVVSVYTASLSLLLCYHDICVNVILACV